MQSPLRSSWWIIFSSLILMTLRFSSIAYAENNVLIDVCESGVEEIECENNKNKNSNDVIVDDESDDKSSDDALIEDKNEKKNSSVVNYWTVLWNYFECDYYASPYENVDLSDSEQEVVNDV